jgi:hypothetical protein
MWFDRLQNAPIECRADKKRLLECLNQGDSGYGMICHRALYSCLKGVEE